MTKKTIILLAASCVLATGCSTANAEFNSNEKDITVKSGYYTCAEDDSYIHVDGNKIELCNFDYEADAERGWNEAMSSLDETERERQASNHDDYIERSIKDAMEQHKLQEFTPYTFEFAKKDVTMLVINFDFAREHGTYTGYNYGEDGTIEKGNVYRYAGSEKPQ